MKIYATLCAFGSSDKIGGSFLLAKNYFSYFGDDLGVIELPHSLLDKFNSLETVQCMIDDIFGLKNWNTLVRQETFYEHSNVLAFVVYSVYFYENISVKDNRFEWKDLGELSKVGPISQEIMRRAAIKRF